MAALTVRVCNVPDCPNLTPRSRCTEHDPRPALYGGRWRAHSKARRTSEGRCVVDDCNLLDLTVDHVSDAVICRSHHAQLEAQRRRGEAAS